MVGPGGGLVVGLVVAQAAVEDPDEPVGEGSEGLVVGVAGCAVPVVVGAGARGAIQRGRSVLDWLDTLAAFETIGILGASRGACVAFQVA